MRGSPAMHRGGAGTRRRRRVVEAAQQLVEQRRLVGAGKRGLVLERVGDAAEEIRAAHRAAERAGQHPDAEREGARDGGKDLSREALGFGRGLRPACSAVPLALRHAG